jgi:hypothetical protein
VAAFERSVTERTTLDKERDLFSFADFHWTVVVREHRDIAKSHHGPISLLTIVCDEPPVQKHVVAWEDWPTVDVAVLV